MLGRPDSWRNVNIFGHGGKKLGIINAEGPNWNEQRRFALKHLRDLGFGKKSLDFVMNQEADQLIDKLLEAKNGEIEMHNTFNIAVVNVLWQIVASKRYDPTSPEAESMIQIVNNPIQDFNIFNLLPTIFRNVQSVKMQDHSLFKLRSLMKTLVTEHLQDIDYEHPRDFIDIYLSELKANQDDPNSNFSVEQLVVICMDFFLAGAETTSTTLLWAVMFMALHPDVQDKCQVEISDQIGSRYPTIEDMKDLPYVMATLNEIQRVSMVAPGTLPHILMQDFKFRDYYFKKGTMFTANVSKFLSDPETFPEPKVFNPERFLDQKEEQVKKFEKFVPFGVGKRICMGESLAKNELFSYFVRLLQRVSFEVIPGKVPNPENVISGITRLPMPFYVKVIAK